MGKQRLAQSLQVIWKRSPLRPVDPNFSPAVYLRGKYLCGDRLALRPSPTSSPTKGQPKALLPAKPSMIPRKVRRGGPVFQQPIDAFQHAGAIKHTTKAVPGDNTPRLKVVDLSGRQKAGELDESGLPVVPHLLNRLTIDNTKRNSQYQTVSSLDIRMVLKEGPRPNSPERCWSGKAPSAFLSDLSDDPENPSGVGPRRIRWKKRLTFLDDQHPKAPLDPEISIPVKPILKRPLDCNLHLSLLPKQPVVITKFVYSEDEEDDSLVPLPTVSVDVLSAGRKGKRKDLTQAATPMPPLSAPDAKDHGANRTARRLQSKPTRVPMRNP